MLAILGYALCTVLLSVYICTRIDAARARRVQMSKVTYRPASALESRSQDSAITRAFARVA